MKSDSKKEYYTMDEKLRNKIKTYVNGEESKEYFGAEQEEQNIHQMLMKQNYSSDFALKFTKYIDKFKQKEKGVAITVAFNAIDEFEVVHEI
jgi:hypothetical protein